MNKIYEQGIQYCDKLCKKKTLHYPKMDAVKNGQRVCSVCSCCNYYDPNELNTDVEPTENNSKRL